MLSMPLSIDDYQKLFRKVTISKKEDRKLELSSIDIGYELCQELKNKNISYYTCITHPEVVSCLDSEMYYRQYQGLLGKDYSICKHLFVRERKKDGRYFLIVVDHEKDVDLKKVREEFNLGKLEFCSSIELQELLNTVCGNVSLFHLRYDQYKKIELILDSDLLNRDLLSFHPLYNGMSLFISPIDTLKYLESIERKVNIYSIPSKNDCIVLEKVL